MPNTEYLALWCSGWARHVIGLAAMLAMATAPLQSSAAEPAWFEEPYDYVVLDQGVREVLTEFGRNLGVPVVLSDRVDGRVRGRIEAERAGEFLQRLASANGLTWYYDGSVLHMSADTEFVTRVLDAGGLSGNVVVDQMRELGLADDRFALQGARVGNVITVSGPPAYVGVVGELVQRMQPEPVVLGDDPRVRVFRGGAGLGAVSVPASGNESDAPPEQAAQP